MRREEGCAEVDLTRQRDEFGAVLILAIIFLLVGTLIVGALLTGLSDDFKNTTNFKTVRSLHYAATNATNVAIESIRYTPLLGTNQTLNASPPSYCWGAGAPSELQSVDGQQQNMSVWCSTRWNPTSAATRVVTFSTCLSTVPAASCAQSPLLQAVVTFDDYPAGVSNPTTVQCLVYCGASMNVNSWIWNPTVPTVSQITPVSGSISGGAVVTVSGTGFVQNGTTVNFIEESGGTPTSDNVVLTVSNPTFISAQTIQVASPSVIVGTTYFVTVTTPSGTSAVSAGDVFTYSAFTPTVTSVYTNLGPPAVSQGSVSGGATVQIVGTGFMKGLQVSFVPESGGATVVASSLTVNSSTSITAVTPSVIAPGGVYYVEVTTPSGNSGANASATFTYELLYPTVWSISPTSGVTGSSTTITITGTGFVTGATVSFVPVDGGNTITASGANVNVTTSNSMTVKSPVVSFGAQYYVYVTVGSSYTSSNNVIFTVAA